MRVQRKIFHLLDNIGVGRNFRYLPKMNPKHHFNWNEPIMLTDKIDGTTVQADNQTVYQRRDKFKTGDPRKFTASEEERYSLKELDEIAPENKWIFEAVKPFRERLSRLPDDVVVYFECFGSKIQKRYRDMKGHSIRVFDFAFKSQYASFTETIQQCEMFDLPVVGCTLKLFSGVMDIVIKLQHAKHIDLKLYEFELEGWVLRQKEEIAKIRKKDLNRLSLYEDKTQ